MLHWLAESKKIIRWSCSGLWKYGYDPIEIEILDVDEFKKLYTEYKEKYINISRQTTTAASGFDTVLILNKRSGVLQWFDKDQKLLGDCPISSERSLEVLNSLWGQQNKISVKDGVAKIWPSKAIKISGVAAQLSRSEKEIVTSIDQLNRQFSNKEAPIFVQRNQKMVFVTARDLL